MAAVVTAILLAGIAEISLLELRFQYFSGGFLQSHRLASAGERLRFAAAYTAFGLIFFGALAALWFPLARRLGQHPAVAAWRFAAVAGGVAIALAAARNKLLSYFSDAVDRRLLSELAGGSLVNALRYATGEIGLVALVGASVLVTGFAFDFFLRNRLGPAWASGPRRHPATRARTAAAAAGFTLAAAGLTAAVARDTNVEWGLRQAVAYKAISGAVGMAFDVSPPGFDIEAFRRFVGPAEPLANGADWKALAAAPFPPHPANVFVFVLESTRADALHAEVDGRPAMPNLAKLAQDPASAVAREGYSHSGFTIPSVKAIFGGSLSVTAYPEETLFTLLKRHGYHVSVVSGQDEAFGGIDAHTRARETADFFFDARTAIEDRVRYPKLPGSLQLSEARILQALEAALDAADPATTPRLVYVNVQAPHFPYDYEGMQRLLTQRPVPRSEISANARGELWRTYLNAVANADSFLGRAFDLLKAKGLWEGAVVAVVADHGESLFDDGFLGHGHALNDAQTRIPFIVRNGRLPVHEPVGENELPGIIVRALADSVERPEGEGTALAAARSETGRRPGKAVFQHVGFIERPVLIGTVEAGGRRTVIDLRTDRAWFSDRGAWLGKDGIMRDAELRDRVARVVSMWDAAQAHR